MHYYYNTSSRKHLFFLSPLLGADNRALCKLSNNASTCPVFCLFETGPGQVTQFSCLGLWSSWDILQAAGHHAQEENSFEQCCSSYCNYPVTGLNIKNMAKF